MGAQENLNRSLKAIMDRQRKELGGPPTPEEILAYRDGRLSPEERERVEARIAVYPDAARALADLAAFPDVEPAPGTPELSPEQVDAGWLAFRQKLEPLAQPRRQEEPRPAAQVLEIQPVRSRWTGAPRLAAAAVAGVALGSAAGFLGGRAAQEVPGPAINVSIVQLQPDGEGSHRSTSPEPIEMAEGTEGLALVLEAPVTADFSDYALEIEDAAGVRLWARKGLRETATGTFQVSFSREDLPAGAHRFRLYGLQEETRVPLASYRVQLLFAPSSPEP